MAVKPFRFQDVFMRLTEVGWGEPLWIVLVYTGSSGTDTFMAEPEGGGPFEPGSVSWTTPDIGLLSAFDPEFIELLGRHVTSEEDWIIYKEDAEASPTITFTSTMTKEIQANVLAFNKHNQWSRTRAKDPDDIFEREGHADIKDAITFINVALLKKRWSEIEDEALRNEVIEANIQEFIITPNAAVTGDALAGMEAFLCVIQEGVLLFYEYNFGGDEFISYSGQGQAPRLGDIFYEYPDAYKKYYTTADYTYWGDDGGDVYNGPYKFTFDFTKDPASVDEEYTVTGERV